MSIGNTEDISICPGFKPQCPQDVDDVGVFHGLVFYICRIVKYAFGFICPSWDISVSAGARYFSDAFELSEQGFQSSARYSLGDFFNESYVFCIVRSNGTSEDYGYEV